jgi:hypothetical protein
MGKGACQQRLQRRAKLQESGLSMKSRIARRKGCITFPRPVTRRWEQGEDPSMLDPSIFIYEKQRKMVVADASERKRWSDIGVRRLIRESKLSQAPVSNAIKGKPVRPQTLSIIRQTADKLVTES